MSGVRVRDRTAGAGALAGRLWRAGERSFVGRAGERGLVASALTGDPSGFAVLFLHGPGGIGKTALLRRMCGDAEAAGARTVWVDGRSIPRSSAGFLDTVAAQLGLPPGEDPVPHLCAGPTPLLLVDTFELCAPLQGWLREEFLPRLPEAAVTVIAGRDPPENAWRLDPGWQDLLRVVALRNLPPADAGLLLSLRGVPEEVHAQVLSFAGGHPLALCLVAELYRSGGDGLALPGLAVPDVVRELIERFVDEAPSPRHRAALEVCAHARVTTESLLRAALGGDPLSGELFDWLRGRSFVDQGPEGLYPHDLARDVLDAELRWRDPDRYAELHRRIREYLLARLHDGDAERTRAWRDVMFLHRRNPVFAPFLTWQVSTGVVDEDFRPADRAALLAMTEAAEGPDSAAVLDHWLHRQPSACRVYRRRGQPDPAGFALEIRLARPEAADLAADPVIAAAWSHARTLGPLRPGEELEMLRTFVVPGAYHRPSPVMDQIQVRCGQRWTSSPGPALSYLVLADPEFWAPQMAYLDHHPAGAAAVGGRSFTLFAHDWRAVPVAEWFRILGDRELGAEPTDRGVRPDVPAPRVVLSEPEFEAAVKDALRCWRRTAELARSPLCRSRLVVEAGRDGTPAQVLADLLVEATDTLTEDPRDAKLHRAVAATFFRGAPSQEAAAERLGLPFSTYRRHVAAGVARVTGWLWDRELHGSEHRPSTD
jgi:hypothetical protein